MPLFTPSQRPIAQALQRLTYCNPFDPERIECERLALGPAFVESGPWSLAEQAPGGRPNVVALQARAEELTAAGRERLLAGAAASDADLALYQDLAVYTLYYRCEPALFEAILAAPAAGAIAEDDEAPARSAPARTRKGQRMPAFAQFHRDFDELLNIPGHTLPFRYVAADLFAVLFQIRRAFHHVFAFIVGRSSSASRLRADIWQSVFTHDMARYRRTLFDKLGDLTTLITGPSGTGKELVARAIAASRYIPFDARSMTFEADFSQAFFPLNISALSPTLVESELFGHRRGAFTGALEDRRGWLETCPPAGTIFLDEVGDIDPLLQVKLLRVLQTRSFVRLGERRQRYFGGKVMAATNRDLAREMAAGRFRQDFYYRLCSDLIQTPTLRQQLAEAPGELRDLAEYIARGLAGEEAPAVADEVVAWVTDHLGADYAWPGNFRELEQCVRNILIRRAYRPPAAPAAGADDAFAAAVLRGEFTAEELLCRYCQRVYAQEGSYEGAARRLGMDRRTVKAKADAANS